jgi:dolichol-phosphate mannosyltransferase
MTSLRLGIAALIKRIFSLRFLKFGTVGASGIVVNQGVLYVAHEYIFQVSHVSSGVDWVRLNLSLALAIFLATLNNFFWNRLWTWADRKQQLHKPFIAQFGQYTLACWLSIVLQAILTNLLAPHFYNIYVANMIAIVLTSVLNFVLNDIWTFSQPKLSVVDQSNLSPDSTLTSGRGGHELH